MIRNVFTWILPLRLLVQVGLAKEAATPAEAPLKLPEVKLMREQSRNHERDAIIEGTKEEAGSLRERLGQD